MRALIARDRDAIAVEDVELRQLGATDVQVRIEASGLCHSDVSLVNGTLPGRFPVVLGHEGSGVIVAVGDSVVGLDPGQRVVLSAMPACGQCWFCERDEPYLCERSAELRRPSVVDTAGGTVRGASGLGTFADELIVDRLAVVPVDTDLPAAELSVIGCAVLTGTGAALNIARVTAGETVLVVGAGGVGLAAIQGARIAGAANIVAVDPSVAARASATACGATHAVPPDQAADLVAELTAGHGVDAVLECVTTSQTMRAAWDMTRMGGRLALVGVPSSDQLADLPLVDMVRSGKQVLGCVYGASDGQRDIPRYVALAEAGRLDLAALVGQLVAFDDMVDVFADPPSTPGRTVMVA